MDPIDFGRCFVGIVFVGLSFALMLSKVKCENEIRLSVWHGLAFGSTCRCTLAIKLIREEKKLLYNFWCRLRSVTHLWRRDWGNFNSKWHWNHRQVEKKWAKRKIQFHFVAANNGMNYFIFLISITRDTSVATNFHSIHGCECAHPKFEPSLHSRKWSNFDANNSNKNKFLFCPVLTEELFSNKRKMSNRPSNQDVLMLRYFVLTEQRQCTPIVFHVQWIKCNSTPNRIRDMGSGARRRRRLRQNQCTKC